MHLATLEPEAEDFFDKVLRHDPCVYCGVVDPVEMTRDHIVPFAFGGDGSVSNLAPACRTCNTSKRRTPLLLFLLKRTA